MLLPQPCSADTTIQPNICQKDAPSHPSNIPPGEETCSKTFIFLTRFGRYNANSAFLWKNPYCRNKKGYC